MRAWAAFTDRRTGRAAERSSRRSSSMTSSNVDPGIPLLQQRHDLLVLLPAEQDLSLIVLETDSIVLRAAVRPDGGYLGEVDDEGLVAPVEAAAAEHLLQLANGITQQRDLLPVRGDHAVFAGTALDKQNVLERSELVAAFRLDHDAAIGYLPLRLLEVEHIAQPVDQRLEHQGIEGNQQISGALAPVGVVRPFRRI